MVRAEASAELPFLGSNLYKVEAWIEGEPDDLGCKFKPATVTPDKLTVGGFTVTAGVTTERITPYPKPALPGSECEQIECQRYYLHFVAVQGIGVSVSKTAGVSGSWITAQHDIYVDLKICADGTASAKVSISRTKGFSGDPIDLKAQVSGVPPASKSIRLR